MVGMVMKRELNALCNTQVSNKENELVGSLYWVLQISSFNTGSERLSSLKIKHVYIFFKF